MRRRAEFRPFGWLHDLWKRDQLDLDPPYQRRSVWPPRYETDFVSTVLLDYPCPAIFLFEEIRPDGSFNYKVIDGKQRLTTLFKFVTDLIAISEEFPTEALRGTNFSAISDDLKVQVWRYLLSVEFVEQENESIINDIFNRFNKNVAKLTPQELRHAKFSGLFIVETDRLSTWMENILPSSFPNVASQSRRQMKDVENVALMLLFIENGERGMSQSDIDKAYADRDEEWDNQVETAGCFEKAIRYIGELIATEEGSTIVGSRIRNQADFYSLFAATVELQRSVQLAKASDASQNIVHWLGNVRAVERGEMQDEDEAELRKYLVAARSNSNDSGPRRIRISVLKKLLTTAVD